MKTNTAKRRARLNPTWFLWVYISLALASTTVLGRFSDSHPILYLISQEGIFVFFGLGLLGVIVSFCRKTNRVRITATWLAAWISVTLLLIGPTYGRESSIPSDTKPLKVLTYNIAHCDIDKAGVFKIIRDENADIVCLQECAVGEIRERAAAKLIAEKTGYQHFVSSSHNAILSKYPLELQHEIKVPTKWPVKWFPEAICQTAQGDVRVISVHMEPGWLMTVSPTEWPSLLAKVADDRRRQTIMILERANQSREPMIAAGDFNGPPSSEAIRRFSAQMHDSGAETTFGLASTLLAKMPYKRIDYVFTRGLTPRSSRVIDTPASDHKPVVTVLTLDSR